MSTALIYTVLSGDTMSSIANGVDAASGVTYQAIEAANPGVSPTALQAGMVINIPAASSSAIVLKYTVQPGDSYAKIASNLGLCAGVTYQQIEAANPAVNPNAMQIGQTLAIPATGATPVPTPTPTPTPTPVPGEVIGFYYWTWSANATPPAGCNMGIAFSGYASPSEALSNSQGIYNKLPSAKVICVGGGNSAGSWSQSAVEAVTTAIASGSFAAYAGIAYDIEEGSAGLESAFADSFAAAKAAGLQVLVTVSHSAPYGISDAKTLMQSFFSNPDIDVLSPQLYTTGSETSNDYATSGGVTWAMYANCLAKVAPSIVKASYYASAQSYFASQGVTLCGYVQWSQS